MPFAIKAEIRDPQARSFTFTAQKTMYGGKKIAAGDTIFIFASENEGGGVWSRAAPSPPPRQLPGSPASPGRRRA